MNISKSSRDHSDLNGIGFLPCYHMRAPPCKPLNCHTSQHFSYPECVSGITQVQHNSQTLLSGFISKSSNPGRDLSTQVVLLKSAGTLEFRCGFMSSADWWLWQRNEPKFWDVERPSWEWEGSASFPSQGWHTQRRQHPEVTTASRQKKQFCAHRG